MRKPKLTPVPGNLIDHRGARLALLVITLIIVAIAAVTYWPG